MAEIPAGRIGHSTEVFVYTGSADYAKTAAIFDDRERSRSGTETNWPQFYPPGKGEDGDYGWRGYTNQPANFQKIGRIRDISGPEPSVNEVEVTSNDSPLNYKEFIPGLKDGGTVSFDMVYDVRDETQTGSGANSLETIFEDGETRRFAVRLPTYRVGDKITDIAGTTVTLTEAATAAGGQNGYADVSTSINAFKNQAFHLFQGFVMRLGNEIPMEDAIMRNVEFKVTGRVESPALAEVDSAAATQLGLRYVATNNSGTFAAGAFTNAGVRSNLLTLPTFSGTAFIGIAYPASEGDLTGIYYGGSSTNQISDFTKDTAVTINGVSCNVYGSDQAKPEDFRGIVVAIEI